MMKKTAFLTAAVGVRYEDLTPYVSGGEIYIPDEFAFAGFGYVPADYSAKQFAEEV